VAGLRRVDLARKVRRYRELVTQRQPSWRVDSWDDAPWKEVRELSASLYRDLLAPIEREWKAAEHLVIAPTGLLHYLPFHALGPYDATTGQLRFVALDTSVSYLTNAGRTDVVTGPRKPRERTLLGLGNPPYRHERPRLSQLQFAEREVNELKTLLGPNALVLAGADASLANLQTGLGGGSMVATRGPIDGPRKFGILHLATHGVVDARSPADSWLALDGTNRLRASDVGTLDLAATHLATLSACQTAIADDKPGTDVMSLAAYFVTAGVPSVLVSLWNVDDRATGELMVKFYQALAAQGDPLHKGKALQAAQRALATRPETRHPYLWAAFELIGDWR
jgi:CHAT domain-containing protein